MEIIYTLTLIPPRVMMKRRIIMLMTVMTRLSLAEFFIPKSNIIVHSTTISAAKGESETKLPIW